MPALEALSIPELESGILDSSVVFGLSSEGVGAVGTVDGSEISSSKYKSLGTSTERLQIWS